MIRICVKSSHCFFVERKVEQFKVIIDNVLITMESQNEILDMTLEGEVSREVIERLWADVFSVVYLYLGTYPRIISMTENNENRDFSKLVAKYNSWEYLEKKYLGLCDVSSKTINQKIINKYRELNLLAIYSMEFLVSDVYKKMIINHKITLLLHVIDGVVSHTASEKGKKEYIKEYPTKIEYINRKPKMGWYKPKVYYLCKNYFYKYDEEFSCELLKVLNVSEYDFVEIIYDTRNFYSHMKKIEEEKNPLREGKEMLEYFEIIYLILRLYILRRLTVIADRESIREYLYILHDWIREIDYGNNYPVKSEHYKRIQKIKDGNRILKEIQGKSSE